MLEIRALCVFNSLRRRFVFLSKGILVSLEGNRFPSGEGAGGVLID